MDISLHPLERSLQWLIQAQKSALQMPEGRWNESPLKSLLIKSPLAEGRLWASQQPTSWAHPSQPGVSPPALSHPLWLSLSSTPLLAKRLQQGWKTRLLFGLLQIPVWSLLWGTQERPGGDLLPHSIMTKSRNGLCARYQLERSMYWAW